MLDRTPDESLARDPKAIRLLLLLTRDGRYVTVPRSSVRLEEHRAIARAVDLWPSVVRHAILAENPRR